MTTPAEDPRAAWFAARSWQDPPWRAEDLLALKGNRTVSVVLPALNEQRTVGGVIRAVRPLLGSLVDELLVMDSGSSDATVAVAREAGARVLHREDVLGGLEPLPGKGEVLWRALAATSGELIVYLDSDLVEPDPGFVPALLGPLLCTTGVHLVKGFYRRPLRIETEDADGGGRVTELMARPLLHALRPELSLVVQPLGGEYAVSREFAESVRYAGGYGVEIGLLLDAHTRYGLDGLAQVNLGVRKHRNRTLRELGVTAREILATALERCGFDAAEPDGFTQFVEVSGEWLPDVTAERRAERPPMATVRAGMSRSSL